MATAFEHRPPLRPQRCHVGGLLNELRQPPPPEAVERLLAMIAAAQDNANARLEALELDTRPIAGQLGHHEIEQHGNILLRVVSEQLDGFAPVTIPYASDDARRRARRLNQAGGLV